MSTKGGETTMSNSNGDITTKYPLTLPVGQSTGKVKITDFALLESVLSFIYNNPGFYEYRGQYYGNYYFFPNFDRKLFHTFGNDSAWVADSSPTYGIKPAICGDWFNLILDEFKKVGGIPFGRSDCYYATFGEYLDNIVTGYRFHMLNKLYKEDQLVQTRKTYSSKKSILKKYIYNGKKYVVYPTDNFTNKIEFKSAFGLHDGVDYEFIEVKPLRFIVDEKLGMAVCDMVVLGGIPLGKFCEDFEKTDLCQHVNSNFLRDILPLTSSLQSFFNSEYEEDNDKQSVQVDDENKIEKLTEKIRSEYKCQAVLELIEDYVQSLLNKYRQKAEDLRDEMNFNSLNSLVLSLEPIYSPRELKNQLILDLEAMLEELKKHNEDLSDYYKMISALDGYITANEEETELTKDIASIKKLITRSLCSDKYPFNDLWAPFNGVIREKFLKISELC